MNGSKASSLIGKRIIGQHGREIGVVVDLIVDDSSWLLQSLEVELNRDTLDEFRLKRPWFGSQMVFVPIGEISGASDNLVLKCVMEDMHYSGGEAAEESQRIDPRGAV